MRLPEQVTVRRALVQAGLAPIDAQVLLAFVLDRDRAWLLAHATDPLATADVEAFARLARRRRDGEPVAYLTGRREFWGLSLAVDPLGADPAAGDRDARRMRIAQAAAAPRYACSIWAPAPGAIALALAHERPRARRRRDRPLRVGAGDRARQCASPGAARPSSSSAADWFDAVPAGDRYDVIASNPPYVAAGDPHLGEGDVRFEPAGALVAGSDGLDALRAIVGSAAARAAGRRMAGRRARLRPGGSGPALFAAAGFAPSKAIATCVASRVSLPAGATEIRQPSVRASGRDWSHYGCDYQCDTGRAPRY